MEGVLRVSKEDPRIVDSLSRAATELFRIHPKAVLYCEVTVNLILQNRKSGEFSIYFGEFFFFASFFLEPTRRSSQVRGSPPPVR